MSEQRDKAFVRDSIDRGLSSLEGNPFLAQRVMAQGNGKEEIIVKKKVSVGFILLAVLMLLMMGAALAVGFGLFGQLSAGPHADDRLPQLEQVAQTVASEMKTSDEVVIEIGQAYYEGDRVFVSYRLSGPLSSAVLHEGTPDQEDISWDTQLENFICAKEWESDDPEVQKAHLWLDGKGQRWAEMQVTGIHDGLYLGDGTYVDIVAGDEILQADGSVIGWKECVIPRDHLTDPLTFKAVLYRSHTLAWQDGTTYRASHTRGESTDVLFTLARSEHYTALKGSLASAHYQAAAVLEQGQVDLKGAVTFTCPAAWGMQLSDWESGGVDMILSWNLYQNHKLVSARGTGEIRCLDGTTLEYQLLYPCLKDLKGLSLVPVYAQSGEHPQEALDIETLPVR